MLCAWACVRVCVRVCVCWRVRARYALIDRRVRTTEEVRMRVRVRVRIGE